MLPDRFFRRSLRDIDSLFERMFEIPSFRSMPPLMRELDRSPLVDIDETDTQYCIRADLPGVRKEDIRVQCFESRTISLDGTYSRNLSSTASDPNKSKLADSSDSTPADTTTTDVEQTRSVLQSERAEGRFFRSFTLPEEIDCSNIDVTYENGLLSIIAPKAEKRKGIPVTINVK